MSHWSPPASSSGGGGSGTVTSVAAADTSIVVSGVPTVTPLVATGTLDVIATNHPPVAAVAMNAQKITGLANGTLASDAAAFGQIPTALPPNGAAGGDLTGTYPNPTVAASAITVAKLAAAVTLDSIATAHATAAAVAINNQKITALANGTAASDAAAFGQLSGLSYATAIFGDGSDGSVTFDGSTTILGMAPSSSIYTLTRDFYFSAVTLNNNVQIKTNGYRIFCSGAFTGGGAGAIIQWNGTDASVGSGGTAISSSLATINGATGAGTRPGEQGAAGSTGAGAAGTAATGASLGGQGGTGGTAGANAGGAGGTLGAPTANQGTLRAEPWALLYKLLNGVVSFVAVMGGTGGGAGGGDGASVSGGGGGGGGLVGVYAKTFAGTGAIQARGGKGGIPAAGNRAGGGGGGGGVVIVISQSVVAGAVSGWTIDAAGGAKGTPTGTATDNATAGSAGLTILLAA